MVWSNWQGAIWRGAGVMLLFWSGLAWTQTPTQRSPGESAEPTMVVHENGKATRCRVLETWALPDGRKAHLLESLETGEKITIVSETMPGSGALNPRAMPIRIFAWGKGTKGSPDGAPLPPHLRMDSGVVIKNEMPRPQDAVVAAEGSGPLIVNNSDDSAIGGSFVAPGPRVASRKGPHVLARFFPNRSVTKTDEQVIEFAGPTQRGPVQTIEIPNNPIAQGPMPGPQEIVVPMNEPTPQRIGLLQGLRNKMNTPTPPSDLSAPPMVLNGQGQEPLPPLAKSEVVLPAPAPIAPLTSIPMPAPSDIVVVNPPSNMPSNMPRPTAKSEFAPSRGPLADNSKAAEPKRSWYPGERLASLWQKPTQKIETAKPDVSKSLVPADPVVTDPLAKKDGLKKADDYLTQENKLAEKKLAEKMEKVYKMPFSTAMNQTPSAPEAKKPVPMPLAIPAKGEEKPAVASGTTPAKEEVKPAAQDTPGEVKRDMFGAGSAGKVLPPGKTTLDQLPVKPDLVKLPPAPEPRRDDPLMAPDRVPTRTTRKVVLPPAGERMAPMAGDPSGNRLPPGSASVLAARNGLDGPIAYIPVPTVTVPQPNMPPMPPPPNMPDAPQLNAHVNAFSAPPVPRGGPQLGQPQGNMMPQQAMMPYGQPMMPYGYPPMPAYPMNPYGQPNMMMAQRMPYQQPMMPSVGPMANNGRQYAGPIPPQNPFGQPMMPAGYGYPPAMPQQPIQQTGYQPNAVAPNATAQQIDQLIKVMRENAYPAQREWAAQMLASYEWRVHPQIVPALLQSAAQDPAASVRAGCVTCLGRMGAAVEPVYATLHALRNDIDPRVRTEVDQAFTRLGQTATPRQQ